MSVPSDGSITLRDKTALITGAGSGIGRAIAIRFARAGARVAVVDVSESTADETCRTIHTHGSREGEAGAMAAAGAAMPITCDVTKQGDVFAAFARAEQAFGRVNILVTSAGVAHVGTIEQTTEEDLDRLYSVNVKGVYNCLKAAVESMKDRGGAILNIASVVSSIGVPDRFAYSMTKGAVLTMTYSIARDYVQHGIRCNCVSPGRIHTPFVDGFLAKSYPGREKEMFDVLARTQPIGRMGTPEEVADLALFLCSDAASFITGSNYAIDGGFVSLKM